MSPWAPQECTRRHVNPNYPAFWLATRLQRAKQWRVLRRRLPLLTYLSGRFENADISRHSDIQKHHSDWDLWPTVIEKLNLQKGINSFWLDLQIVIQRLFGRKHNNALRVLFVCFPLQFDVQYWRFSPLSKWRRVKWRSMYKSETLNVGHGIMGWTRPRRIGEWANPRYLNW